MADDYYIFDEEGHRWIGERNKQIYRLGDKVHVQVIKTNLMTRTIDFRFVTEEEFYKDQGSLVTLKEDDQEV